MTDHERESTGRGKPRRPGSPPGGRSRRSTRRIVSRQRSAQLYARGQGRGPVGRKTRRAEDMASYSNFSAPVLSRAVGVPPRCTTKLVGPPTPWATQPARMAQIRREIDARGGESSARRDFRPTSGCSLLRILEARLQGFHEIHHFAAGRRFLRRRFALLAFRFVLNQFFYVFRVRVAVFGRLEFTA